MKHLLWMLTLTFGLSSCGEFFQFDEEQDNWDSVQMHIPCDSAYVMVGDSIPLTVEFVPDSVKETSVYWTLDDTLCARLHNDTLVALSPGSLKITAVGGNGRLSGMCTVNVIDRWNVENFNCQQPSDMVIYANVSVNGEAWDDSTMVVGAFVRGELAGVAVKRKAFGIPYAELRIWALSDQNVGRVELRCYDRRRFRLFYYREEMEFTATRTLGTLSNLYPINF